MVEKPVFRIGELARKTGKTVRALRYYEELGLLEPTTHTGGGFRLYDPEEVKRVELIERLQGLGFSLDRIREIVEIWRQGQRGEDVAARLHKFFEDGLTDIRERIRRLQRMEAEMADALGFLTACGSCQDQPGREVCCECKKGDHEAHLPSMVDALVR